MPPVEIEEVSTTEALERLRPEWALLWERCPAATPFQSPEWLLPWWRRLGRGRLRTLALRREGRLVGLAPLFVHRYFGLPLRRLSMLGTGVTDYLDFLLPPEIARSGAEQILGYLASDCSGWDFMDFQQIPPGSPLLSAAAPSPLKASLGVQEVCPVLPLLPLPASGGGLPETVPSRLRANLRYYRRRLEKETEARFETADRESLPELLEGLFRLHEERWKRRRLPGVFSSSKVRGFHHEVAEGMLAAGRLRLHGLRVEGELKAALYCFQSGGRGYYYGGGFDPGLARFSPGTLLTGFAIEDAVRGGAREFDFMRGDEPYKYLWGAQDRQNHRLLVWRPSFPGSLAPFLNRWEQRGERWIKALARRLAASER
jgi:CelD/BcsL family acetyltransferase involved in cellulose biosynthesis